MGNLLEVAGTWIGERLRTPSGSPIVLVAAGLLALGWSAPRPT